MPGWPPDARSGRTPRTLPRRRFLAVLAGGAILAACRPAEPDLSWEKVRTAGRLRVALDPSYPPLSDLDPAGEPVGFEPDLCRSLAAELGLRAEFLPDSVEVLPDLVLTGRADLASGLNPGPEFEKRFRFTSPYIDVGYFAVTSPGGRSGRLGFEAAGEAEGRARELARARSLQPVGFGSARQLAQAAAAGEVDVAVLNYVIARQAVSLNPRLVIEPTPLISRPLGLLLRAEARTLYDRVEGVLNKLRTAGILAALEGRWFGRPAA